ncbi:MAG: lipoyl(octanoyl) transferase LipB [Deltaproteobacteria bacterium]|nr:lipoyl(octanoyl) transferase LipB [Deltaproteobacteria bacterium]
MASLEWIFLGPVSYSEALELQARAARQLAERGVPQLLLMEHPPVVTLGRHGREESLRLTPQEYDQRGIELHRVERGGDATFHGPGQLVGYPIASLRALGRSVPAWVEGHADALRRVLSRHGIQAQWSAAYPGLWIGQEKIAAFGFRISRGVSTHGFALNVDCDLTFFDTITPCGLDGRGTTSMAGQGIQPPPMGILAAEVARELASEFDLEPVTAGESLGAVRFSKA